MKTSRRGLGVDARAGELTPPERRALERYMKALLAWQEAPTSARWPPWPTRAGAPTLPLATPFVSVAKGGELRGSTGSSEGTTTPERIVRAFLAALHDARARPIAASERAELSVAVSFLHSVRRVRRSELAATFAAGTHGLAAREPDGPPVLLLPEYASFGQMDSARSWSGLVQKNGGRELSDAARVYVFASTRVIARPHAKPYAQPPIDAAAAWLAGMVQPDGRFVFEVDPRTAVGTAIGDMHHARSATALTALVAHGGFPREAKRAARRLAADLRAALRGETVEGWPLSAAGRAGTVALAAIAGLDFGDALLAFARLPEVIASAWHAPQVAAALGPGCPPELWQACVDRLASSPWSPWTTFAASRVGDDDTFRRAASALIASVPTSASRCAYPGGVGLPRPGHPARAVVPETALTALVVEALVPAMTKNAAARRAVRAATSFVQARQLSDRTTPLLVDPRTAEGAFAATPVDPRLRIDVVGHALSALLAAENAGH